MHINDDFNKVKIIIDAIATKFLFPDFYALLLEKKTFKKNMFLQIIKEVILSMFLIKFQQKQILI